MNFPEAPEARRHGVVVLTASFESKAGACSVEGAPRNCPMY